MTDEFASTMTHESLVRRARWIRRLREFFWAQGFIEVETPVLSRDTVVDRHLEPIVVPEIQGRGPMFLQTSPEFAMKRLLLSGVPAMFQIAHAFRDAERGEQHNPEFLMAEWYRVGDDYEAGQAFLMELAQHMFEASRVDRLSYREAFVTRLQLDPFNATDEEIVNCCRIHVNDDPVLESDNEIVSTHATDLALDQLMTECIQPTLGQEHPTLLLDYPADQAALARTRTTPYGEVAERFELFVKGVELANGYHELIDPDELVRRNKRVNEQRHHDGNRLLPVESRLLDAMRSGLPPCCGVALGVDRSLQVALGEKTIDQILPFPIERA